MTMYRKNFSGQTGPDVGGETHFVECNFGQPAPIDIGGVMRSNRLWSGDDTPRTFMRCALVNAEPPPGSTIDGSNTCIKHYALVTSTETIRIDGEDVIIEHHSDRVYGRILPDGTYEYKDTPEDIEVD